MPDAVQQHYNIALGAQTTLNELFEMIRERLAVAHPHLREIQAALSRFRQGDILHSQADIGKARRLLGYRADPQHCAGAGRGLDWYVRHLSPARNGAASKIKRAEPLNNPGPYA